MALGQVLAGNTIYADDIDDEVGWARPLYIGKASDETVFNSAALQADNHLTLAAPASATFELLLRLIINSSAVADFKVQFTYPAGTTMSLQAFEGSSPTSPATVLQGPFDHTAVAAFSAVGADQVVMVSGLVFVAGTAGNVALTWAQNTANASNTIVRTNSYMILKRVA